MSLKKKNVRESYYMLDFGLFVVTDKEDFHRLSSTYGVIPLPPATIPITWVLPFNIHDQLSHLSV